MADSQKIATDYGSQEQDQKESGKVM